MEQWTSQEMSQGHTANYSGLVSQMEALCELHSVKVLEI